MSTGSVYLDYNATAPLLDAARAAMMSALDLPGNPSSVHRDGRAVRAIVEKARRQVAQLVGAAPSAVTFTSGATEAAVTVLTPRFKMGKADLAVGHLFHSRADHPCILAGGRFEPHQMSAIGVDRNGMIDLAELRRRLAAHDPDSGLPMVCLTLANNETGVIQPMADIAETVRERGAVLVLDVVQAVGRVPVDIADLGADFLILSSHKIGGPKGVGALVSAGEVMMPVPLIPGGGQEKGHRSGTENPAGIAGFGAAAAHVGAAMEDDRSRISALRDGLEDAMRRLCGDCIIYGAGAVRLPNTTFFALPGLKAETAQIAFDLEGVSVSAGSACSSGKVGPSHVLAAMGFDADQGAIRVSLGAGTTREDLAAFLAAFEKIDGKRRSLGSEPPGS